jgi:hypothetical protein
MVGGINMADPVFVIDGRTILPTAMTVKPCDKQNIPDWAFRVDPNIGKGVFTTERIPDGYIPKKEAPEWLWRFTAGVNSGAIYSGNMPAINSGAFRDASNLKTVTIPSSVKSIADDSFSGTAVTHVEIAADCDVGLRVFPDDCVVERK